jgi:hypothetical protein
VAPASSVGAVIVTIFLVSDPAQDEVRMSASMAGFTRVMPSLLCSVFPPACNSKSRNGWVRSRI